MAFESRRDSHPPPSFEASSPIENAAAKLVPELLIINLYSLLPPELLSYQGDELEGHGRQESTRTLGVKITGYRVQTTEHERRLF